jgi:hypothetical protein
MKFIWFLIAGFFSASLIAAPLSSNDLTHAIPTAKIHYGLDNFKIVMPGVLYRGGSSGDKLPLASSSLQALCNDGFSTAVYVYSRGESKKSQSIICQKGQMDYVQHSWDNPTEVHKIHKILYQIITAHKGPMYVHCWYGMHASGYVAATALIQFCGLSNSQAINYWKSHVPVKIQYKKVQDMIRGFKPDPAFKLSPIEQAHHCLPMTN